MPNPNPAALPDSDIVVRANSSQSARTSNATSTGRGGDYRVALIGFLGAVGGVVITALTNYFVTTQSLERIELPKLALEDRRISLENRRISLEGHKLALSLTPKIETRCFPKVVDAWTLRILCNSKNDGGHQVDISINEVQLGILSGDTKEVLFSPSTDSGFGVTYPNDKRSFRAAPGTDGDLWFYIAFDKKKFPQGRVASDVQPRISLRYGTLDSLQQYAISQFPELETVVRDAAVRGTTLRLTVPTQME